MLHSPWRAMLALLVAATALGSWAAPALAATPQTDVLIGQSVLLDASAQGHPTRYEWYVVPPGAVRSAEPDSLNTQLDLALDKVGDWTIYLVVRYAHTIAGTAYVAPERSVVVRAHSVLASVAAPSPPVIADAAVSLDGSASQVAAGVSPEITWRVTGPSTYLNCPHALTCTIPGDTLLQGTYTAMLTLHDPVSGDSDVDTTTFDVLLPGITTEFTWTPSSSDLMSLRFSASISSASSAVTSATWDFGDGSVETLSCLRPPGCTGPSHLYSTEGIYQVTLTAHDLDNRVGITRHSVATGAVVSFSGFESGDLSDWSAAVPQ